MVTEYLHVTMVMATMLLFRSLSVCFLDETRKILREQECEKTLIALLSNEVVDFLEFIDTREKGFMINPYVTFLIYRS